MNRLCVMDELEYFDMFDVYPVYTTYLQGSKSGGLRLWIMVGNLAVI